MICIYAQKSAVSFVKNNSIQKVLLHILDNILFLDLKAVDLHLTGSKPSAADDITVLVDAVI